MEMTFSEAILDFCEYATIKPPSELVSDGHFMEPETEVLWWREAVAYPIVTGLLSIPRELRVKMVVYLREFLWFMNYRELAEADNFIFEPVEDDDLNFLDFLATKLEKMQPVLTRQELHTYWMACLDDPDYVHSLYIPF